MTLTRPLTYRRGFTLVEVIVVMALFTTVFVIAAQTFKNIVVVAAKYAKAEDSNIEGMIGLEVLRHDLEQMGFGLYWGYLSEIHSDYRELSSMNASTNDAPRNVPRAFVSLDNSACFSSDHIGVKATTVGVARASQRWTYVPFHNMSSSPSWMSRPVIWPSGNLNSDDKVIVIRHNFNDPADDHLLIDVRGVTYETLIAGDVPSLPVKDQQVSMVYGVADKSVNLGMPFNRVDFFITTSNVPPHCAELTGVLSKALVNHGNGNYDYLSLLDCVADMQVVLGWDSSDRGMARSISGYSNADGTVVSGVVTPAEVQGWLASPLGIREHLRMVKIYILAQEGRKDTGYSYPSATMVVGNANSGETSLTNTYTFSTAQRQYHWKLYRVIVRPRNLLNS